MIIRKAHNNNHHINSNHTTRSANRVVTVAVRVDHTRRVFQFCMFSVSSSTTTAATESREKIYLSLNAFSIEDRVPKSSFLLTQVLFFHKAHHSKRFNSSSKKVEAV
jgi:hypothetical protein